MDDAPHVHARHEAKHVKVVCINGATGEARINRVDCPRGAAVNAEGYRARDRWKTVVQIDSNVLKKEKRSSGEGNS